jgi:hypothetical protein
MYYREGEEVPFVSHAAIKSVFNVVICRPGLSVFLNGRKNKTRETN